MSALSIKEFAKLSQKEALQYLNTLNQQYNLGTSPVSDEDFDNLVDIYEKKFSTKFDGLTVSNMNYRNKTELPYHMNSLDKVTDKRMLDTWIKRLDRDYESDEILVSDKIDGISMMLQIKDGDYKLYTRGKNKRGTDVSHLFPYINFSKNDKKDPESFKQLLKYDIECRGELVCPRSVFESKYKNSGFSNARNLVGGTVVAKDFDVSRVRDFVFIGYEVYEKLKASDMMRMLTNVGIRTPQYTVIKKSEATIERLTDILQRNKTTSDYEMDGIVLAANDRLSVKKRNIDENPKHMIAFKIRGETTTATVEEVEWNLSKNGIYKPRVRIVPVVLNDVVIKYCSGFNGKYIVENNIGPGAEIVLTRAGDVIPDILQVIKGGKLVVPERYKWNESGVEMLVTDEDKNNDDIIISQFVYMFKELEIKNMGESTVRKIVEAGHNTIRKVLRITKDVLLELDGIKDRSADRILEAIDVIRKGLSLTDWMLVSCKFQNFGRKKLTAITDHLPNVLDLDVEKIKDELSQMGGMNKMIDVFVDCLPDFKKFYSKLDDKYKLKQTSKGSKKSNKKETLGLSKGSKKKDSNVIVIFTGVRDKELRQAIETTGGEVLDNFSTKATLVVAKDPEGSSNTIKKAQDKGIAIISLEDARKRFM
jgi:DNA ligase (NAD+)